MRSSKWKRNEAKAAGLFGVKREPSNGRPQADWEIEGFSVETKERAKLPKVFLDAISQGIKNCKPGKAPMVVMIEARGPGYPLKMWAVVELKEFAKLHEMAYGKPQAPQGIEAVHPEDEGVLG